MSLVSDIIQQAYRETNLIPLGATPTPAQMNEGIARLTSIILSAVGNEIAEPGFRELTIGGDFDQSEALSTYIPDNTRLMLQHDTPISVGLMPGPYEGQRFAISDMTGNLFNNYLVIEANSRLIEGEPSITLQDNGLSAQWLYRSDTGNWVRITGLNETDPMPFPADFDDYFVTMVALRLSPRYGQMLPSETIEILKRSRNQLRARYRNRHYIPSTDPGLLSRDEFTRAFGDPETAFDTGVFAWLP